MFLRFINIYTIFFSNKGQATVEAAVMIPIIFLIMLLLIQPGIYLYDKMVMNEAAVEACRVLSTCDAANKQSLCEPYIKRRLSAIPQQDNFHVHSSGCSYQIELNGDQASQNVSVKIKNQIKPLPLIGFLSDVFGILNSAKNFDIYVEADAELRPSWVASSPQGIDAENWVGEWLLWKK